MTINKIPSTIQEYKEHLIEYIKENSNSDVDIITSTHSNSLFDRETLTIQSLLFQKQVDIFKKNKIIINENGIGKVKFMFDYNKKTGSLSVKYFNCGVFPKVDFDDSNFMGKNTGLYRYMSSKKPIHLMTITKDFRLYNFVNKKPVLIKSNITMPLFLTKKIIPTRLSITHTQLYSKIIEINPILSKFNDAPYHLRNFFGFIKYIKLSDFKKYNSFSDYFESVIKPAFHKKLINYDDLTNHKKEVSVGSLFQLYHVLNKKSIAYLNKLVDENSITNNRIESIIHETFHTIFNSSIKHKVDIRTEEESVIKYMKNSVVRYFKKNTTQDKTKLTKLYEKELNNNAEGYKIKQITDFTDKDFKKYLNGLFVNFDDKNWGYHLLNTLYEFIKKEGYFYKVTDKNDNYFTMLTINKNGYSVWVHDPISVSVDISIKNRKYLSGYKISSYVNQVVECPAPENLPF